MDNSSQSNNRPLYYVKLKSSSEKATQLCRGVPQKRNCLLRLRKQHQYPPQVIITSNSEANIYVCEQKIGRGKYSEVFLSYNLNNS